MRPLHLQSAAEQVAGHLREGVMRGELSGVMPGVKGLSAELGVNHKTVEAALGLLEMEGQLVPQGAGRRRRIVLSEGELEASPLRVAILDYEPLSQTEGYILLLKHLLEEAGHAAFFTGKSPAATPTTLALT